MSAALSTALPASAPHGRVPQASAPDGPVLGGSAPRRLDGVDGLRALAALWVVLFHVRAFSGAHLGPLDLVIRSGSTGVSLFLVLSGFCLYLPVARHGVAGFRTGRFLLRRARRLLPAYYVSLAVVLLVAFLVGGHLGFPRLGPADVAIQAGTHITLTHSLFPGTFYALDGAYWSLALEWQLYLALPLLVFGVRRFGLARIVAAVFAVNIVYRLLLALAIGLHAVAADSLMATAVLPNLLPGRWAEFALGMVAAQLYATGRVATWTPRLRVAMVPIVPLAVLTVGNPLSHLLFGAVFFTLLCAVLGGGKVVTRVFGWRPLVVVGVMSYSIYLVHQPLVQAFAALLRGAGGSPTKVFGETVLLLPLVLAVAWLLFIGVERHTLRAPGAAVAESGPEALLLTPLRFAARLRSLHRHQSRGRHQSPAPGESLGERQSPMGAVSTPEMAAAPHRRHRRNLLALGGGQLVTWASIVCWTLVVPRGLGPSGMGMLVTASAIGGIVGVLVAVGTRNYLVYEMVRAPERTPRLLGASVAARLALILPAMAAVTVYLRMTSFSGQERLVVYLGVTAVMVTILIDPFKAVFQAVERMEFLALGDVGDKVIQTFGAIALVAVGLGVVAVSVWALTVEVLILVLHLLWVRRFAGGWYRRALGGVRRTVVDSLPYWAFGLAYTVYLWIDSAMLAVMAPPTVVGWYGVSTRLFGTLMVVATIISTAWLPRLVTAHAQGRERLWAVARSPMELILVLSLPLAAGMALVSGPAIRLLYGGAYAGAAPVMAILALTVPPTYLNIMANQVLVAAGRQSVWTKVMLVATVVNPLLNLMLIRLWQEHGGNGAIGAAVSFFITEVLLAMVAVGIVGHRLFDMNSVARLGRALAATLGMAACVAAVQGFGAVVQVAVGLVSFAALALVLRLFAAEQIAEIRAIAGSIATRLRPWRRRAVRPTLVPRVLDVAADVGAEMEMQMHTDLEVPA